jgi:hypothetical protein
MFLALVFVLLLFAVFFIFPVLLFFFMFPLVFFPIFILLPCPPVFLHLTVRNVLMAGRYLAPVRGKVVDMSGKTVLFNINPSSVIACGTVPVSLIRPIPVPAVEDDVDIYRRRIVGIGSRNDEYIRRSRQEQGRGWRRDVNPNVNVHSGKAAADHDEKK